MGSANDFAHVIGVATVENALAAWRRFCTVGDDLRTIDLGTIQAMDETKPTAPVAWQSESLKWLHFVPAGPRPDLPQMGARIMQSQLRRRSEAERELTRTAFYASIAGTSLDAAVNRLTLRQPRWLRAHGGYLVALIRVLGGFQPPHITLSVEVNGSWQTRLDEPGFLIAGPGNGPQYGHGMRLTHQAQMDDGLLDICFVRRLSKLRLLRLFRVVYRGGHVGMKEVEYFRASRVRIRTDPATEIFADGEPICTSPVELGVRRRALRLIVCEWSRYAKYKHLRQQQFDVWGWVPGSRVFFWNLSPAAGSILSTSDVSAVSVNRRLLCPKVAPQDQVLPSCLRGQAFTPSARTPCCIRSPCTWSPSV